MTKAIPDRDARVGQIQIQTNQIREENDLTLELGTGGIVPNLVPEQIGVEA